MPNQQSTSRLGWIIGAIIGVAVILYISLSSGSQLAAEDAVKALRASLPKGASLTIGEVDSSVINGEVTLRDVRFEIDAKDYEPTQASHPLTLAPLSTLSYSTDEIVLKAAADLNGIIVTGITVKGAKLDGLTFSSDIELEDFSFTLEEASVKTDGADLLKLDITNYKDLPALSYQYKGLEAALEGGTIKTETPNEDITLKSSKLAIDEIAVSVSDEKDADIMLQGLTLNTSLEGVADITYASEGFALTSLRLSDLALYIDGVNKQIVAAQTDQKTPPLSKEAYLATMRYFGIEEFESGKERASFTLTPVNQPAFTLGYQSDGIRIFNIERVDSNVTGVDMEATAVGLTGLSSSPQGHVFEALGLDNLLFDLTASNHYSQETMKSEGTNHLTLRNFMEMEIDSSIIIADMAEFLEKSATLMAGADTAEIQPNNAFEALEPFKKLYGDLTGLDIDWTFKDIGGLDRAIKLGAAANQMKEAPFRLRISQSLGGLLAMVTSNQQTTMKTVGEFIFSKNGSLTISAKMDEERPISALYDIQMDPATGKPNIEGIIDITVSGLEGEPVDY